MPGHLKTGGEHESTTNDHAAVEAGLVETELEMVRATWLLQHSGTIRCFRWLGDVDRVQRSKID